MRALSSCVDGISITIAARSLGRGQIISHRKHLLNRHSISASAASGQFGSGFGSGGALGRRSQQRTARGRGQDLHISAVFSQPDSAYAVCIMRMAGRKGIGGVGRSGRRPSSNAGSFCRTTISCGASSSGRVIQKENKKRTLAFWVSSIVRLRGSHGRSQTPPIGLPVYTSEN